MHRAFKIGIVGGGTVGEAMAQYFSGRKDVVAFLYDPPKKIGSRKEINQAEIIFITVPTPYSPKDGYSLEAV